MLKLAWKPGPAADFTGPVVLTATRFTYRSLATMPAVYRHGLALRRAWDTAEGSLGLGLSSDLATRTTYTLSAWQSEEHLRQWVQSPGHAPLMRQFRRKLSSSAVHTFRAEKLDRGEAWRIGLEQVGLHRVHLTARQRLGAGPNARFIEHDGKGLACFDVGSGPPIVCLHAIGHGAGDFETLAARLASQYRVIAIDWPGHGLSDDDEVAPSAEHYAGCLEALMSQLRLKSAVLIGNSIGGGAALRFAAAHPDRVAGLVLENSSGLGAVDATARLACSAMAMFFRAGESGAFWFPAAYERYYRGVLRSEPAAERRAAIVAAGPAMAGTLAAAWQRFGSPETDLRETAAATLAPALVAWARRDRLVSYRRSRAGIERLRGARVELFEAGHTAHLEAPEQFERVLHEFLVGLSASWVTAA